MFWFYRSSINTLTHVYLCTGMFHINSVKLSECLTIQFSFDTNYPEVVQTPQDTDKFLHKTVPLQTLATNLERHPCFCLASSKLQNAVSIPATVGLQYRADAKHLQLASDPTRSSALHKTSSTSDVNCQA